MSKTHLLAGPNNAGKSNVLRVAKAALPSLRDGTPYSGEDVDRPLGEAEAGLQVGVMVKATEAQLYEAVGRHPALSPVTLLDLFSAPAFARDGDERMVFMYEVREDGPGWIPSTAQVDSLAAAGEAIGELSLHLTSARSDARENAFRVLNELHRQFGVTERIPQIAFIGAFRQIRPGAQADVVEDEHDGPGLIERLADLQNPGYAEDDKRERFARINRFVQRLFDDEDAAIEVPHGAESITIRHGGRRLPLDSYGTGLHEVVILAVAATVLSENLVCIEEPEVHLHPTLQRKLLRYLNAETDNHYLIATHSAHMLDSATASITAVRLEDGHSTLSPAIEPSEVSALSFELGAKASDLVQANSVIWVEGPSDLIYVKSWIEALDPNLIEGIHFSIIHYGGRLLSHLSADDAVVDELVRLPRINRHFAVLMDSDRKSSDEPIGDAKQRIFNELEALDSAQAWITHGYTIEDYIPPALLATAITATHPNATLDWDGDPFQNPLSPDQILGSPRKVDKIAIARHVTTQMNDANTWPYDLKDRVQDLVTMIRAAND